jgi:hypothetical protein
MKRILGVALAGALALSVAGALPAMANDRDVIARGACSGSTDWKLKLSPDDGRIEVEYEVDSNVNGQTWKVKIFQNGQRVFSGNRVTSAPSGSFEMRTVVSDQAGADAFTARARNRGTGETCGGSASF